MTVPHPHFFERDYLRDQAADEHERRMQQLEDDEPRVEYADHTQESGE